MLYFIKENNYQEDGWFLTLPDGNGQPDTPGSNKDGQEDSISKETASKNDQEPWPLELLGS